MGKGTPKMYQCNECSATWSEAGKVTQCINCKGFNIEIYWEPGTEKFDIDDPMWRVEPVPSRKRSEPSPPMQKSGGRRDAAEVSKQRDGIPPQEKDDKTIKPVVKSANLTDLFNSLK